MIEAASRAPRDARSARDVSILVGLGALVRLALLLRGSGVGGDEAAIGVNGLAIRHGEFPIYFAGQSFMGAAGDAYLAGLAYIVLGVAPVTLELVGVLLSIAWVALVVRLVWEAWGSRAAAYTALWLAVPPDLVLWWAQEARPHYHLPLVLGVLELLVARRVPGSSPPAAARRLAVLGLLVGLGYWTNFLSIVYLPVVVLRLALGGYRPRSLAECALPVSRLRLSALAPHLLLYAPPRARPSRALRHRRRRGGHPRGAPAQPRASLAGPPRVNLRDSRRGASPPRSSRSASPLLLSRPGRGGGVGRFAEARPRAWGADLAALVRR